MDHFVHFLFLFAPPFLIGYILALKYNKTAYLNGWAAGYIEGYDDAEALNKCVIVKDEASHAKRTT